jgi:PIN domain nuclease of toxin-antitoxin system
MATKYLLDTNVLLYLMTNDRRLGKTAQDLLDRDLDRCVVSVASLWEIAIKQRVRKLELPAEIEDVLDELQVRILPLAAGHIARCKALPNVDQADPFDLILLAQAISEEYIFMTADKKLLNMTIPGLAVMNCRV